MKFNSYTNHLVIIKISIFTIVFSSIHTICKILHVTFFCHVVNLINFATLLSLLHHIQKSTNIIQKIRRQIIVQ